MDDFKHNLLEDWTSSVGFNFQNILRDSINNNGNINNGINNINNGIISMETSNDPQIKEQLQLLQQQQQLQHSQVQQQIQSYQQSQDNQYQQRQQQYQQQYQQPYTTPSPPQNFIPFDIYNQLSPTLVLPNLNDFTNTTSNISNNNNNTTTATTTPTPVAIVPTTSTIISPSPPLPSLHSLETQRQIQLQLQIQQLQQQKIQQQILQQQQDQQLRLLQEQLLQNIQQDQQQKQIQQQQQFLNVQQQQTSLVGNNNFILQPMIQDNTPLTTIPPILQTPPTLPSTPQQDTSLYSQLTLGNNNNNNLNNNNNRSTFPTEILNILTNNNTTTTSTPTTNNNSLNIPNFNNLLNTLPASPTIVSQHQVQQHFQQVQQQAQQQVQQHVQQSLQPTNTTKSKSTKSKKQQQDSNQQQQLELNNTSCNNSNSSNSNSSNNNSEIEDHEEKKKPLSKSRINQNLASKKFRDRKKEQIKEMEDKMAALSFENQKLLKENEELKDSSSIEIMRPEPELITMLVEGKQILLQLEQALQRNDDRSLIYLLHLYHNVIAKRYSVTEKEVEKLIHPYSQLRLVSMAYIPQADPIFLDIFGGAGSNEWINLFKEEADLSLEQSNKLDSLRVQHRKINDQLLKERQELDLEVKKFYYKNILVLPGTTCCQSGCGGEIDPPVVPLDLCQLLEFVVKLENLKNKIILSRVLILDTFSSLSSILTPRQEAILLVKVQLFTSFDVCHVEMLNDVWNNIVNSKSFVGGPLNMAQALNNIFDPNCLSSGTASTSLTKQKMFLDYEQQTGNFIRQKTLNHFNNNNNNNNNIVINQDEKNNAIREIFNFPNGNPNNTINIKK